MLFFIPAAHRVVPRALFLFALCILASTAPGSVAASDQNDSSDSASVQGEPGPTDSPAAADKPWLVTPTVSADPKLGANIGGVIAYLKALDDRSTPSMLGLSASYSDTDSVTAALWGQMYWQEDTRRLSLIAAAAEINNEYDDFLGTGLPVKTQDNLHTLGFRYLHQFREGGWFAGIQGIRTNYAVGGADLFETMLNQFGLSGFDAAGLGLVFQHDTMDHQRDPSAGHLFTLHNFAYREGLGGESSFDVGFADLRWYRSLNGFASKAENRRPVIAIQAKGRFTSDAPLSGYSSVTLPGYTMGNYLSRHYSHILVDGRFPLTRRLGLVAFGGVGCQFGDDIVGSSIDCGDNVYPSVGIGLSYVVKEEASVLIRLEVAKGKNDNEALYLRFGHPF